MNRYTAIILSAGKGRRIGGDVPKQYIEAAGKPLLYYSVKAFEESNVTDIIIVAGEGDEDYVQKEIADKYGFTKVSKIVTGGSERYFSVLNGLRAIEPACDYVLIHDGARPFIKVDVINKIIDEVVQWDAVIAGMPVKDTIKISDGEGFVASTTNRRLTWQIQTPQAFRYDLIMDAYEKTIGAACAPDPLMAERAYPPDLLNKEPDPHPQSEQSSLNLKRKQSSRDPATAGITDDASVFEIVYPGKKIRLTEGGYGNIKITTKEDLEYAARMLENQ